MIEYRKKLGRFKIEFSGYWGSIYQYHANGSDEIVAEIIQLNVDSLKDLRYLITRALEDYERSVNADR